MLRFLPIIFNLTLRSSSQRGLGGIQYEPSECTYEEPICKGRKIMFSGQNEDQQTAVWKTHIISKYLVRNSMRYLRISEKSFQLFGHVWHVEGGYQFHSGLGDGSETKNGLGKRINNLMAGCEAFSVQIVCDSNTMSEQHFKRLSIKL